MLLPLAKMLLLVGLVYQFTFPELVIASSDMVLPAQIVIGLFVEIIVGIGITFISIAFLV